MRPSRSSTRRLLALTQRSPSRFQQHKAIHIPPDGSSLSVPELSKAHSGLKNNPVLIAPVHHMLLLDEALRSERPLMSAQRHTAAGMCNAGIRPWAGDQEVLQFKCLQVLPFLVELDVESHLDAEEKGKEITLLLDVKFISGKTQTTVLYRLKFNEFVNTVPTIGFNTEKIKLSNGTAKGISCHFWDVGGQEKLRPLWKSYSRCTDGIIYVVDSVDVDRLEEAKTELHKVTKFAENQGTPLLVIANKQDLPKSLPVAEIEKQLALHELIPATTYHVQPACAIIGEGLTEGMDKLYEMILKRRKSLKQKKKR
ncbi:hypothetical protein E2I00_006738 [Balaenoptera physalus]|uniref:ADP-ribosylation factor-like protein 4C n=1 Tax=Balaenoptera physalus TaxID=9770 RepID=A0A643C8T3_BALPH|nr:hypothetical protein E2I00_006738 [Balaenoptera physalus]